MEKLSSELHRQVALELVPDLGLLFLDQFCYNLWPGDVAYVEKVWDQLGIEVRQVAGR